LSCGKKKEGRHGRSKYRLVKVPNLRSRLTHVIGFVRNVLLCSGGNWMLKTLINPLHITENEHRKG
jgi:hypothetical protein